MPIAAALTVMMPLPATVWLSTTSKPGPPGWYTCTAESCSAFPD